MASANLSVQKFLTSLRNRARLVSSHNCAQFIRLALKDGGADTAHFSGPARLYAPLLRSIGYYQLGCWNIAHYRPMRSDIVIIQAYEGGNLAGHITAFDGRIWISDFKQKDMWSGPEYRKQQPEFAIFRLPFNITGDKARDE